jgi:hypothetical protein
MIAEMQGVANEINEMKRQSMFNSVIGDSRGLTHRTGDQLQEKVRNWLSPPDPSTNHNIARRDHLSGTSSWLIRSDMFKRWKDMSSLLWVHGKRAPPLPFHRVF